MRKTPMMNERIAGEVSYRLTAYFASLTRNLLDYATPTRPSHARTGATGVLALSREAAQAAGLLDGRPRTQARSVSLGGVSLDALVTASQVRFAGRELTDVQVQIYAPSVRGPIPQGLLGALETFEMALDLRGGRLFLTPGARRR